MLPIRRRRPSNAGMNDIDPDIAAVLARYADAVLRKDVDAFMALYDDGASIFDLWGKWHYDGKAAWREVVDGWLSSLGEDRVVVRFAAARAQVDACVASVHAFVNYANVGPDGAVQRAMDNRLTWTLVRSAEGWAIVHEHTSAPVDFESMKVQLTRLGPGGG